MVDVGIIPLPLLLPYHPFHLHFHSHSNCKHILWWDSWTSVFFSFEHNRKLVSSLVYSPTVPICDDKQWQGPPCEASTAYTLAFFVAIHRKNAPIRMQSGWKFEWENKFKWNDPFSKTKKKRVPYKSSAGKYSDDLFTLNRNGTCGNSSGYINTLLWHIKFKIRSWNRIT